MLVTFPLSVPADCPFTIYNLPYGVVSTKSTPEPFVATVVGKHVLNLAAVASHVDFLAGERDAVDVQNALKSNTLKRVAGLQYPVRKRLRETLINMLSCPDSPLFTDVTLNREAFVKGDGMQFHLPLEFPDFVDFSISETHLTNMAKIFNAPALPQLDVFPIAYNGRTSSVVASETPVYRPHGFFALPGKSSTEGSLRPSQKLDIEVELGIILSQPLQRGVQLDPQSLHTADEIMKKHVFGYLILNDWSARDIQAYEMTPLGPLQSKSFCTSISTWVVPIEALGDEFNRVHRQPPLSLRKSPAGPLVSREDTSILDIELEVLISRNGNAPEKLTKCSYACALWSPVQMIKYLASCGSGFATGTLLGTGTLSTPEIMDNTFPSSLGCLQEITMDGRQPLKLSGAEELAFLEDEDEITITAWAKRDDGSRCLGLGSVVGKVLHS